MSQIHPRLMLFFFPRICLLYLACKNSVLVLFYYIKHTLSTTDSVINIKGFDLHYLVYQVAIRSKILPASFSQCVGGRGGHSFGAKKTPPPLQYFNYLFFVFMVTFEIVESIYSLTNKLVKH